MKSFFDKAVQDGLLARIERLNAQSVNQWGKMTPAQMLSHCNAGMQIALGGVNPRLSSLSIIGRMLKGWLIHSDKPFGKNSPTAPELRMQEEKEFETEKQRFMNSFHTLSAGPSAIRCHQHPFFGNMSNDDWGCLVYKHLDHHMRQFGV